VTSPARSLATLLAAAVLAVLASLGLIAAPAAHAAPPAISAPSAIVIDATTGDVAYAKAPDQRRPIASTTKLMTALLTLEAGGLKDVVSAPRYRAAPAESRINLVPGERMTEADLLRGLLVASANDAAATLAQHVGGSIPSFVRMMNRRARQLGLTNTSYANPIGLDEAGNYSTARDLVTLTRTLRKHRFFRRTVDAQSVTLQSGNAPRRLANRNTLLDQAAWVDGVKTGYTRQAGDVLVASGRKRGVRLISAVLGEPSKAARNADSLALLNYGFSRYRRTRAVVRGEVIARVPIQHRAGAVLPLAASTTVHRVLRRDERFELRPRIPHTVDGPISYGQEVGKLDITVRGKVVRTIPLTAALEVPKAGVARRTQDAVTTPWTLVVLAGLLVVAAVVTRRLRPAEPREERPRRRTPAELDEEDQEVGV